jgi:hypothetical protein
MRGLLSSAHARCVMAFQEREEVPVMSIVGGFDIHRRQVTFDYLDTGTGQGSRGRISPACRVVLRAWLERFAGGAAPVVRTGCCRDGADCRHTAQQGHRYQLVSSAPRAVAASAPDFYQGCGFSDGTVL